MSTRTHQIFVIHSYRHDGNLQHALIGMLRDRPRFKFYDHSIPDVSQYLGMRLRAEIRKRIERADVILVIARPATSKSQHIQFEVDYATRLGRPIIAIRPPDAVNLSSIAQQRATAVVDWDAEQIVAQIRKPGRRVPTPAAPAKADPAPSSIDVSEVLVAAPLSSETPREVLSRVLTLSEMTQSPGARGLPLPPDRNLIPAKIRN